MLMVTERVAEQLVAMDEAIDVVEDAFARLYRGEAEVFPVVAGRGDRADTFFGIKSGVIDPAGLVGFKIGTYWPANRLRNLAAHASTTFLLDGETGRLRALLASSYLTCVRTAAADGVGIRHLSRPESTTVGMVGTGHQAWFELKAACQVRPIKRVLVWNRTPITGETFARRVREELHIEASTADLRSAVEEADIVITSTASREPLVSHEWVRPGTHISAMGSDAIGKGELTPALIRLGRLFCDVIDQSITLGDFESAFLAGLIDRNGIVPLGAVITGDNPGRASEADITIFDSSGTALQDLAIGALVLSKAVAQGLADQIDTVGEEEASTAERVQ